MTTGILGQSGLAKKAPATAPGGTKPPETAPGADEELKEDEVPAPVAKPPRRRTRAQESVPSTVYFWPKDLELAADVVHALKKSGRLKGLVRGQIGVSLVVAHALNELREAFEENETAVIDRIVLMLSRRTPA